MILVIAEKPSAAQSIAKVLGATSRKDGYLEGNIYIVSWCVGHLVGLAGASSYDECYAKWRYDDLPIVPGEWLFEVPKDKAQERSHRLIKGMKQAQGITRLKAENALEWVGRLNNVRACAREIVDKEIVNS